MSDNFPEKNIADKLTQLADTFRGITPESGRFPENYPGKRIADKIDELIAIVKAGEVIGDYDKLENKPAIDDVTLNKDTTSADVGLATLEQVNYIRALIGGGAGEELNYLELPAENLIDEANKLLHQIGAIFDIPYDSLTDAVLAIDAHDQEQDTKLQTLNGHYYPLDGFDFGKSLDVKTPDPDDVALLTTYAMTMEGVSDPSDIIEDTVIKNEFDGVEFVWNAEIQAWTDWGIGNIVTAGNDHLGVVEGTADPGDGSKDGFVTVLLGGMMKVLGFSELKTDIAGKVDIQQAGSDAGKALVIQPSGEVSPGYPDLPDNSASDAAIGSRTLADQAGNDTLVGIEAKGLTAWLQGIRNNLKAVFSGKVDKNGTDRLMTAAEGTKLNGIAAGAQVNPGVAIQAEAEVGTDNTKMMTPLRVIQAIAAKATTALLKLTGYSKSSSASAIAATDSINDAIGKLEKSLDGKEATFTKNTAFNKAFETSTSNIKENGTVSVGTSSNVPRADHAHGTDTSRAPANATLTDAAISTTLPATSSTSLVNLIQTVRNNLKALFGYFTNGIANSAAKWSTARTVSLSGDITGSASIDGSANAAITATLASSGVSAGSYGPSAAATLAFGGSVNVPQITVDAKGRATSVANRAVTLPATPTSVSGNAGTATKLITARTVDGVGFDGTAAISHFGSCSTAAATAAKTVALSGFSLVTGAEITITFTVTNTASSPTLNVNGTGAKSIYYRNTAISVGYLAANRTYKFVYDGTQYELIGDVDTNTTYSVATTSANGLMSSADKTNLNSLVSLAADIDSALDLINGESL